MSWSDGLADRGFERLEVRGAELDERALAERDRQRRDAAIEREITRREARNPIDRLLGR